MPKDFLGLSWVGWAGLTVFALLVMGAGTNMGFIPTEIAGITIPTFAAVAGAGGNTGTISVPDNDGISGVLTTNEIGRASAIEIDAFTGEHGKEGGKTEVYPTLTVQDNTGALLVNDLADANFTSATGDSMVVYCTGATYYCDLPEAAFGVVSEAETFELDAYTVVGTADLVLVAYADDGITALTADDSVNNTADYAGGALGAGQDYAYYIELQNFVADETFRLGAVATYYCGAEVDDFYMTESQSDAAADFEEVSCPKALSGASYTIDDDTLTNTTCSVKHCYEPKGVDYIQLLEWEKTGKLQFIFEADDTTGPTANGDTYIGAIFMDAAWDKNGAGTPTHGWYMPDDGTEDPGAVGLDENPETTFNGLDVAVCIEPQ